MTEAEALRAWTKSAIRPCALATALALALAGCAEQPKGSVLDYPPGAFGSDGKPVSHCLRVFGSDCLAPAPNAVRLHAGAVLSAPDMFKRTVMIGEIAIPIVRMNDSAKAALGTHVDDLAAYLDERTRRARKESASLTRS